MVVLVLFGLVLSTLVAAATRGGPSEGSTANGEAIAATASQPASSAAPGRARVAASGPRPNIVVITTDDQDLASLSPRTMPNVTRLLQGQGTTFTDYVVSGPLCCPSRAVFLTGQYGHNNGVTWNNPGYSTLIDKRNTLPVWLDRAGYRTAHVGGYLNRYSAHAGAGAVAPGWDEWHTMVETRDYYDYTLQVNGRRERYGSRPSDYVTRVYNRKATDLIRRHTPDRRPLFLSLDHRAPHGGPGRHPRCSNAAKPDPRDEDLFRNARLPRGPSFNEADTDDKPSFVSSRRPLGARAVRQMQRRYGCRLASLRAVDRGVGEIHRALSREGELDDTVILFTSDNGWFAGEHRIPDAKVVPYEEAIRVPFVVRAPPGTIGSGSPARVAEPVANVDVAPTILQLARARPCSTAGDCRTLDGRSLLGLLRGNSSAWPGDRGVLLEMDVPSQRAAPYTPCDYEGIRTAGDVLIEHHSSTGRRAGACSPNEEAELYDLRSDPHQLRNLAPADPSSAQGQRERSLAERLASLAGCAGIAGRDPQRPGTSFCE